MKLIGLILATLTAVTLVTPASAQSLAVVGHRGSAYTPENTLPGIAHSASLGAQWVEVDVRATSDRVPVAVHDKELDRTSNCSGKVNQKTRQFLYNNCRADERWPWYRGTTHDGKWRHPTLANALSKADKSGVGVLIDMKAHHVNPEVRDVLEDTDVPFKVMTNNPGQRDWFITNTDFPVVHLTSTASGNTLLNELRDQGVEGVAVHYSAVSRDWVARVHARGMFVWVWTLRGQNNWLPGEYKSDGSKRDYGDLAGWVSDLSELGIDGVITDEPDRVF